MKAVHKAVARIVFRRRRPADKDQRCARGGRSVKRLEDDDAQLGADPFRTAKPIKAIAKKSVDVTERMLYKISLALLQPPVEIICR